MLLSTLTRSAHMLMVVTNLLQPIAAETIFCSGRLHEVGDCNVSTCYRDLQSLYTLRCLINNSPRVLIFRFFVTPSTLLGPLFINFEANEVFLNSFLHFSSLLVLFRSNVKAKLRASVCISAFCYITTCFCRLKGIIQRFLNLIRTQNCFLLPVY